MEQLNAIKITENVVYIDASHDNTIGGLIAQNLISGNGMEFLGIK